MVRTYSGAVVFRPDTTRNRRLEDWYVQEGVDEVSVVPAVCCAVARAGRCVGESFASRYAGTSVGCFLLYPENVARSGPEGFASACTYDCTSLIPDTSLFTVVQDAPASVLSLSRGTDPVECVAVEMPDQSVLHHALCEVSRTAYLRLGDMVVQELCPRRTIASRASAPSGGAIPFTARIGNIVKDFRIIF